MLKTNLTKSYGRKGGFTLLFAVLVSTLVVSIGASIISVAVRQTILSGTSRESQYAFYAANTVLECAFYWDIVGVASSSGAVFPADGQVAISSADAADVKCSGMSIVNGDDTVTPVVPPWSQIEEETTFYLRIADIAGGTGYVRPDGEPLNSIPRCAQATITKTEDDGIITTRIDARGYNTCDISNPRRVERGLIQEYQS